MKKHLFAIDLGASGGKCFTGSFDKEEFLFQEIHRFGHEGVSFFIPDRKGCVRERTYWDDTAIYHHVIRGLQIFRREIAPSLDSIAVDTWGADGQFITTDGDLLGKVFCYRDHRLDSMIDEVKKCIDARRVYELTGIHFQPFNESNQVLWFVRNRPELFRLVHRFLPIPSLFYYYLGGSSKVDSSWASVTQLMDARKKEWSEEILDALGIPLGIMPEIVPPGTQIGTIHEALANFLGLNRAALVAIGSHDTASAFAAAPVEDPDESLIVSSGTWSLVGKLVPEPVTTREAFEGNISNEGGVGNIRLLKNCMGTWLVQELRRQWAVEDGKETDWAELVALADKAPQFTSLIDPDDPSFYNPQNMAQAIDAFCKKTAQSVPENRGMYLRAIYESLALKYRLVNELICSVSNTSTRKVHIVGGGSKNRMLNQFTADALGVPVVAGPDEATAAGNIMVQALGLGMFSTLKGAPQCVAGAFPLETCLPEKKELWEKQYNRFKQICG